MSGKSGNGKNKKKGANPKVRDKKGRFVKGAGGRPKGSKNKKPAILVDKILEIEEYLATKGKGLKECAEQDPQWFFEKLLAKILPKPVDVSSDISGEIIIKWQE